MKIARMIVLLMLLAGYAKAEDPGITLKWELPAVPDVAGSYVYIGAASKTYTNRVQIAGTTNQVRLVASNGIAPGKVYYFAVSAYSTAGAESEHSNEVSGSYQLAAIPKVILTETENEVWRRVHVIEDGVYRQKWERVE